MTNFLIPSHQGRSGNDPIFALAKEAASRKQAGEDVINATLGALFDDAGELVVLPAFTQAMRSVGDRLLAAYAPIAGPPAFTDAVCDDFLGSNADLRERAFGVATPGGTGALRHCITTFIEPGQKLLTTSFFWGPYGTIAAEHGRSVATFNMFADSGELDTADLDRALGELLAGQGRALVIVNDPCHNPTGYTLSESDWQNFSEVLLKHADKGPIAVVLDSAYAAFKAGSIERPVKALGALADRILVAFCWSASKTFLAYGQRVGGLVVVAPQAEALPALRASFTYSCRGTWSNCNHAGMAAITKLLADETSRPQVDGERAEVVKLLDARVAEWNEFARPKKIPYPRYDGGFFVTLLCDNPGEVAKQLREEGIFVVPLAKDAIRIAICAVPQAQIRRLVDGVAKALGLGLE